MVYAVIDTNIVVSSFMTKNVAAATRRVINSLFNGLIIPLYNEDIIAEYSEVLHRNKFHLAEDDIRIFIDFIRRYGIDSSQMPYEGEMPDEDDRVFYEVTLSREDSFLVTGNLKHFPKTPQVVTASQIMEILESE